MLSHFPTPYCDEILYSVVARYHIRSGNKSFKQTHQELFETTELQPDKILLPNNLNFLVSQLPHGSSLTVESLIKKNTLYPFFRTFLIPIEINLLKDLLREKPTKSIAQAAKISDKERNNVLKFCFQCLQEDEQKYGEAYWHRQHQIPGMLVCLKHQTPLSHSQVFFNNDGINYLAASQVNLDIGVNERAYPKKTLKQLLSIAEEIDWLTSNYHEFKDMTWLRNQYKLKLTDRGFITRYSFSKFKYHNQQFTEAFIESYGEELIKAIQPQIVEKIDKYLEYYLLSCDITQTIDRISHVLIVKFLYGSIKDIFDSK